MINKLVQTFNEKFSLEIIDHIDGDQRQAI